MAALRIEHEFNAPAPDPVSGHDQTEPRMIHHFRRARIPAVLPLSRPLRDRGVAQRPRRQAAQGREFRAEIDSPPLAFNFD
jgi:hypothetical protein